MEQMLFGDSLDATRRAAREHWWGIDKNMLSTADGVAVVNHSSDLTSFLGGKFTRLWTGSVRDTDGSKVLIPDPHPELSIGKRPWSEVQRLTNADGTRWIHSALEHARLGVEFGVVQVFEAKGQELLDHAEFWDRLGRELDSVGHPRVAMTLSDIGSPLRRVQAAHAVTPPFQIAILPRGPRRQALVDEADAVWGTQWDAA